MSNPEVTNWPNRPELPWYWFAEWGSSDAPIREIAAVDRADPAFCCISSIVLSTQAGASYFDLELNADGDRETLLRVLVTDSTPVSITFPTPLVIGGHSQWDLSGGPAVVEGLFQATLVGYWARAVHYETARRRSPAQLASVLLRPHK